MLWALQKLRIANPAHNYYSKVLLSSYIVTHNGIDCGFYLILTVHHRHQFPPMLGD